MMPLFLLIVLVQVLLLQYCLLALLFLNLVHELLDAALQTLLKLLFRLSVLFKPVSCPGNSYLELATALFTLPNKLLVFRNVLL